MQRTPRQALLQLAGLLNGTLLVALEEAVGKLSEQARLLVAVLTWVPPQAQWPSNRGWRD